MTLAGKTLIDTQPPAGVRQFRAATRLPVAHIRGVKLQPKNLSIGGVFLFAKERPPIGSTVVLTLVFGDVEHTVQARVTHHQSDGYGLSFIEPTPELVARLRTVLDDHVPPTEREAYRTLKQTMYRELGSRMHVAWSLDEGRYDATVFDLSDRGVFLRSDIVPDFGAEICVYLPRIDETSSRVSAAELHATRAKVVFRNSGLIGSEFLAPSAEFRMTIRRLLAR